MESKQPNDFVTWLSRQKDRDDPVGDLAYDFGRDENLPKTFANVDNLYNYVKGHDGMVIAALFFALEEWSGCEIPSNLIDDWSEGYEGMLKSDFDRITDNYAFQPRPKGFREPGIRNPPEIAPIRYRLIKDRKAYQVR